MNAYAVVAPGKGRVELREVQVPDPGAKEIQVRIQTSVISPGTERAWILNLTNTPGKYPFEPGYCAAGIVEKTGAEVTKFVEGDHVACFLVPHRSLGNIGEEWAVKIPRGVAFEEASFMPLGQIAMSGVRKTRIELGEKVMVIGLGVIGQLALQFARLNGALPAIGVDRVENRLEIALKCGADKVFNSNDEEWLEAVGEKPSVVIESTGMANVIKMALDAANTLGRVSLLGSTRGESTIDFYSYVHAKGVQVIGAHAFHAVPQYESSPGYWTMKADADCFMSLLSKRSLNITPLITTRVNWKEVEDTYKKILEWNTDMIGTIINWN